VIESGQILHICVSADVTDGSIIPPHQNMREGKL